MYNNLMRTKLDVQQFDADSALDVNNLMRTKLDVNNLMRTKLDVNNLMPGLN